LKKDVSLPIDYLSEHDQTTTYPISSLPVLPAPKTKIQTRLAAALIDQAITTHSNISCQEHALPIEKQLQRRATTQPHDLSFRLYEKTTFINDSHL
jgi:hypothetical protein